MAGITSDITQSLLAQIEGYKPEVESVEIGHVLDVGDGIAHVSGLPNVRANELVRFSNGVPGIAFNLEQESVGVIIMGEYSDIREGDQVRGLGRIASVPVGPNLLGRVVDGLGTPVDNRGAIVPADYYNIERMAPGVIDRQNVYRPVQTGVRVIDALTPIGRGQRELIIGDRQTGKTALAIDAIINQKGKDLKCIYVAIGKRKSEIATTVATLEKYGAMDYTIIVVASASDPAALQYLAPYAGAAMGEYFMENGQDALVVYDDLSKHAWAYRQVSLLLRRPPGREAYPGDLFYLHSRLLERAAQLSEARGGGSLTALPIIETLLGDIAAYVPTNVISITDGQIFLEGDLFYAGIRPAMNTGISVSRVGGDAQVKGMRQVAGGLRLDMANFRSLAAFAQFGSDLDKDTQRQLDRGRRLTEILKQPQYRPTPLVEQIMLIYAGTRGYLDEIEVERIKEWEDAFTRFMSTQHTNLVETIETDQRLTEEIEGQLKEAITNFNSTWS